MGHSNGLRDCVRSGVRARVLVGEASTPRFDGDATRGSGEFILRLDTDGIGRGADAVAGDGAGCDTPGPSGTINCFGGASTGESRPNSSVSTNCTPLCVGDVGAEVGRLDTGSVVHDLGRVCGKGGMTGRGRSTGSAGDSIQFALLGDVGLLDFVSIHSSERKRGDSRFGDLLVDDVLFFGDFGIGSASTTLRASDRGWYRPSSRTSQPATDE
mmetsp:Transcript_56757/g.151546  ORF Transcript_56757/g.151546 Transcript_56757/m.151546 type:complete len:213 (+) Transcript_56757:1421-2059(+)